MAGKIKRMIDAIIAARAAGDETLVRTTRTKLLLKGIAPDSYTLTSEDDPAVLARLELIAQEFELKVAV